MNAAAPATAAHRPRKRTGGKNRAQPQQEQNDMSQVIPGYRAPVQKQASPAPQLQSPAPEQQAQAQPQPPAPKQPKQHKQPKVVKQQQQQQQQANSSPSPATTATHTQAAVSEDAAAKRYSDDLSEEMGQRFNELLVATQEQFKVLLSIKNELSNINSQDHGELSTLKAQKEALLKQHEDVERQIAETSKHIQEVTDQITRAERSKEEQLRSLKHKFDAVSSQLLR
eukprot:TRINITY_DN706_c0_g2_i1.p1 TRINITY_DN706_c0_g2~~TRINITY_DN706_c0_g2_i1.p1  ORF type:complete len:226 (-),score=97.31 TRINITY_DN706_c0_g2_i1:59-736(-)